MSSVCTAINGCWTLRLRTGPGRRGCQAVSAPLLSVGPERVDDSAPAASSPAQRGPKEWFLGWLVAGGH